MKIKDTVGTVIRKLSFDFPIQNNQDYRVLENSIKDFKKLTKWAFKSSTFSKDEIIFMFEHPR